MTKKEIDKIASDLVDYLFCCHGPGTKIERSERLVLEFGRKLDGPGWRKQAVKDEILKALKMVSKRLQDPSTRSG
jgi:hypothetical protein